MAPHGNDPLDSPRPLELRQPAPGPAAGGDDLDDLLNNYDFDDPFADDLPVYKPPSPVRASNANSNGNGNIRKRGAAALGIDEEIEVEKKYRAPRAKLDEERSVPSPSILIHPTDSPLPDSSAPKEYPNSRPAPRH
jgi:hypothetical protein